MSLCWPKRHHQIEGAQRKKGFQVISLLALCKRSLRLAHAALERAIYLRQLTLKSVLDVDGGYGEWTLWSGCSEECGGGQRSRTRACDNPLPKGSGKDCSSLGNDTEIGSCGTMPCPGKLCFALPR